MCATTSPGEAAQRCPGERAEPGSSITRGSPRTSLGWETPVLAGLGLLLALVARLNLHEAVVAGAWALLAVAFWRAPWSGLALGAGYGFLALVALSRGGGPGLAASAIAAAGGAALCVVRPRGWPPHFPGAVVLAGLVAASLPLVTSHLAGAPLSRAPLLTRWPWLVACFLVLLLAFARQSLGPAQGARRSPWARPLAAVGLGVAALAGLLRFGSAALALRAAERDNTVEALEGALARTRDVGWFGGEARARLGLARLHQQAGAPDAALDILPSSAPLRAEARFVRARSLLALGDVSAALEDLRKGLALVKGPLPPLEELEAPYAGLLLTRHRKPATELMARARNRPESDRFLAEAAASALRSGSRGEAQRLAAEAQALAPDQPWVRCAAFEIQPGVEQARHCAAVAPGHLGALRVLAAAGDEAALAERIRLEALGGRDVSFAGLFALRGARVIPARLRRGEALALDLTTEAMATCGPGEDYRLFVHLAGPQYLPVHAPEAAQPRCVRGEWVRGGGEVRVPSDAAPGPYRVLVGFAGAASGSALVPDGMPDNVRAIEVATVEVLP